MIKNTYDIFEDEKLGVFQIRSKGDVIIAEFNDEEEKNIFRDIIQYLQLTAETNLIDLYNLLLEREHDKDKVLYVFSELKEFNLINESVIKDTFDLKLKDQLKFLGNGPDEEGGSSASEVQLKIQNSKLVLFGNGILTEQLLDKAVKSGFEQAVSYSIETEQEESDLENKIVDSDLLIVDADQWNPFFIEELNRLALRHKKPWILIPGIDGIKASVGPLFIGKETGCYHCLSSRLKSNMEFLPYFEGYEKYLRDNKKTAKNSGGPIALYEMLASLCMLEVIKYVTGWAVPVIYKAFITINMYDYEFKVHSLLKSPGCPVCSPSVDFNIAPWLEPVTLHRLQHS